MSNILSELKRRKVIKVAGVYAVVAWIIIQIGEATFEALNLPSWALTLIIVLLFTGFPIAIIFAWIFDKTPEGKIKIDEKDHDLRPIAKKKRTWFALGGIAAGLIAGIFFARMYSSGPMVNSDNSKSIAVLPFTTFSEGNEENTFFADGMHDDILTQLSKIEDLTVISRTSVMEYKNTTKKMKEIAKELNVQHILEGSVRRAGNQIRIIAQLINAVNDKHIWSETYDRDYGDIFAIQSDVAKKIATALRATLTPEEIDYIDEKPTDNLKAWELYARANMELDKPEGLPNDSIITMYEQATKLDEKFLQAWGKVAYLHVYAYFDGQGRDPSLERLKKAEISLEKAKNINADHPDYHKAAGFMNYYGYRDYDRALEEFYLALDKKPNDAELFKAIGWVQRRKGQWEQSLASIKKAHDLDPRSNDILGNYFGNLFYMRKWDERQKIGKRYLALNPNNYQVEKAIAFDDLNRTGDLKEFENTVTKIIDKFGIEKSQSIRINLAYLNRDVGKMIELMDEKPEDWTLSGYYSNKCFAYFKLGNQKMVSIFADSLELESEKLLKLNPNNSFGHINLGIALAFRGNKKGALRETGMALKALPLSEDALEGANILNNSLDVLIIVQEYEKSLDLMDQLLSIPSNLNHNQLRYNPFYDPLRDNPRFQKLLAED